MSPWLVETIVVAAVAGDRADRDARLDRCAQRLGSRAAMARATAAKSMMPVSGECSAATPTAWGSISGISAAREAAQARDAVLDASAFELVERAELAVVEGDDELAAALVRRSPCCVAVGVEGVSALGAELGLQRPGLVVDAGVDDAGVVARLVGGDRRSRVPGRGRARRACGAAARGRWRGRGCPPPTTTTSQGGRINGSRARGRRRRRGGSRSRSPRGPG